MQMSILENGSMAILDRVSTAGFIRSRDENSAVSEPFPDAGAKAPRLSVRGE